MVQVLSCHHFKSQTVVSPSHEPVAIFAAGNHLFVATSHHSIEVYKLDGANCSLVCTVKTAGIAWNGTFSIQGNYIAVLEKDSDKSNHLRVYFNWDQSGDQESVTKARIIEPGSPRKPIQRMSDANCLEVVEIRTKRKVQCVACCSETGNLVAGMKGIVSLFRLTQDGSHQDLQHFIDIVMDDFRTINIDIHGAHLAFTSTHEAHILLINSQKFHISIPPTHSSADSLTASKSVSSHSVDDSPHTCKSLLENASQAPNMPSPVHSQTEDDCIVNDEHCVEWTFGLGSRTRSSSDHSEHSARNQIILPSIHNEEYVKQKDGPAEILGPVRVIPGIAPFKIRHAERTKSTKGSEKIPSYIHLLYCRFPNSEPSLMSAQLLPTYIKAPHSLDPETSAAGQASESFQNRKLLGMSCLLSTPKQGLVYDLLGQVYPLSCYLYTGEAISLQAGKDFLYAVSSSGLETYTHRVAAAAIHKKETFDSVSNTCPDPTTDICLIGLRPFLGVQTVTSCDRHVILMCKVPGDGEASSTSDWSVYVLQKAPIADIHQDMIELASGFRRASPSAYQHVVTEAHLMVRGRLMNCECSINPGEEGAKEECCQLKELFCETSSLLGKIYAESKSASERPLTLPYLQMSEKTLPEILEFITGSLDQPYVPEDMSLGSGLAHLLDFKLFSEGSEKELGLDEATAERIADVYCHLKPSSCSEIILSKEFKGHLSTKKKLDILQKLKQQQSHTEYEWSNNDNIAMILVHLELGEIEQAKFATSCLTPDEVIHVVPTHSDLILDETKKFTDFARLLCKESMDSMVALLHSLLDNDQLTLVNATAILKDLHGGSAGSSLLLTRLLESVMCSSRWQRLFPGAMQEIIPIYLSQLLHADEPSMMNSSRACRRTHAHVPAGDGCFAARFTWLNNLPPFQGSLRQTCTGLEQKARNWRLQRGRSGSVTQPQTPTKSGANCPCCCCNEVLMRLQSLLCSEHLTEDVSLSVMKDIGEMKKGRGRGSLQLLCQTKLDIKAALSLVIQDYPSIAVEFSSQHCGHSQELWSHVLLDLVRGLEEKTTDGMETRKAVSLQMLSGVLGYLVQELAAPTLLALLPDNLPLALTMPYMERSLLRNQAGQLREEIVATGLESIGTC